MLPKIHYCFTEYLLYCLITPVISAKCSAKPQVITRHKDNNLRCPFPRGYDMQVLLPVSENMENMSSKQRFPS